MAISSDADTTLASWARDAEFPVVMGSDQGGRVQAAYGSYDNGRLESRAVFIVGPDGRIAHYIAAFNALSANAYTELGEAIDRISPPPPGDSTR